MFLVVGHTNWFLQGGEISVQWRETLAPGEAVLERSTSMWVVKMASVLFGHFQGPQGPLKLGKKMEKDS